MSADCNTGTLDSVLDLIDNMEREYDPCYHDRHPAALEPVHVSVNGGQIAPIGQAIPVPLQPGPNQIVVQAICGDANFTLRFTVNRNREVPQPSTAVECEVPTIHEATPTSIEANDESTTFEASHSDLSVAAEPTAIRQNDPAPLVFRVSIDGKRVDVIATKGMTAAELFTVIGSISGRDPTTLTGSMIGHGTRRINIDMCTAGHLSV